MRVQLIRKFADIINGIDLTNARVGDIVNVKAHEAAILVMEGWAREVERNAQGVKYAEFTVETSTR